MRRIGWHRIGVVFILSGLILGAALPSATMRVHAAQEPVAMNNNLDICGEGTGSGRITGRVTRADDGTPIEGVRVYVTTVFDDDLSFRVYDLTAAGGTYELTGLASGTYVARTDATLYNAANSDSPALVGEVYEAQSTPATFTPVQVVDGQVTDDIDFSLAEGGTLKGRITDLSTGLPLEGEVTLHRTDAEFPGIASYLHRVGDSGNYTFTVGLPPGSYKVGFRSWAIDMDTTYYPNTTDFAAAESIEITGTATEIVDLAVTMPAPTEVGPQGEVRGRITVASGGNLRDFVRVRAFVGDSVLPSVATLSDANGLYTMTVPAGEVKIMAEPGVGMEIGPNPRNYTRKFYDDKDTLAEADSMTVPENDVLSDVDFAMELGGRISGRVTYTDGTSVSGVTVSAFTGTSFNNTIQSARAQTDASGYYSLTALANGIYTVTASLGSSVAGCYYPLQQTVVEIDSEDAAPDIDFTLARGAYITGRVTAEDTSAGLQVAVRALLPTDSDTSFGLSRSSATTGYYRVGPLAPGEYKLLFVPPASSGLGQVYFGGTTDRADSQAFLITGDEVVSDINELLPVIDAPNGSMPVYLPTLRR